MQLFGSYTSPFVRHIRIVLAQTGLDFELIETDYEQSATQSPACRVPFLRDGERMLTDSLSILRYIRQRAGQDFFPSLDEFDQFLLADTALDACVNVFLFERDGYGPEQVPYLKRQQLRIGQCLETLDEALGRRQPEAGGDFAIRLGCFLSWALFRKRFGLESYPALAAFRATFESDPQIAATHPPDQGPGR
jgi:glutathione S-transferase